ncbi:MAG: 23S rRNA (uracil(1939)-C(5))-methyltransferase RlmD, partial [Erysipelotrichaceae bacterium]|nr:23S rRNA (uracil(1939)-C(5))-methyltransferase RlmD [Erysipelotrichaceae bacterium]
MKCPKAKLCGGCPLLSISYKAQGEQKRQKVLDLLAAAHLRMDVSP